MKVSNLAWRNLCRQRRRSLLAGSAIFFAILSVLLLLSFAEGMTSDMARNLTLFESGTVQIRQRKFIELERFQPLQYSIDNYQKWIEEFGQLPTVQAVLPRVNLAVQGFKSRGRGAVVSNPATLALQLRGLDFILEQQVIDLKKFLTSGSLPQLGSKELVLSPAIAQQLELKVGDKITLIGFNSNLSQSMYTFTISGIIALPLMMAKVLLAPIAWVQQFAALEQDVLSLNVIANNAVKPTALKSQLQQRLPASLVAQGWGDVNTFYAMMESSRAIYLIITLVFALLASTVLLNTMTLIFYERINEIAILRCLGMQRYDISRLLLLEVFYLALISLLSALAAGVLISLVVKAFGGIPLPEEAGANIGFSARILLVVTWRDLSLSFALGLLVLVTTSWLPVRRILKVGLFDGLRGNTSPTEKLKRRSKALSPSATPT